MIYEVEFYGNLIKKSISNTYSFKMKVMTFVEFILGML